MTPACETRRPIRILHVVDSLKRGGLERVVTDLAIAQNRSGCDVQVFSIDEPGGFVDELHKAGIVVIRGGKRRSADLGTLRRLRQAMARRDIVHVHNFMPSYYAAAALLGLANGPCLVGTCHDMGTRLAQRKLRWIVRWALGRTRRVAMVGEQVRERYVSSGLVAAARAECLLNGVEPDRFRFGPHARQAARAAYGLPGDALVVGCVGRLVPLKNHRIVIESMPRLLMTFPRLHVVIAGGGPLHDELVRRADELGVASHLSLAGELSEVAGLLPAFDVFVHPSLTEGLSIALLEAAASGLPTVATDVGGNGEIVVSGRTGVLVPVQDPEALAAAIEDLLANPARREALGAAARAWTEAHASIESMRVAYDGFYRRAMRDGEPRSRTMPQENP